MRKILVLALGAFALGLDAYVMAGLLPVIAGDTGSTVPVVAQMVTAFTLAYAIAAPLSAAALAGAGTRTVLVLSLAVFTAANGMTAVATGLPLLIVSRVIAGAGAGLYSSQASTAAAALAAPGRQGRALATIMGGMSAGTVLGVPLGVLLAEHAGWRATLWLITALGAAVLAAMAWLPPVPAGAVASARERLTVLVDRRIAPVAGVSFLAAVASLGLYTYLAPVLADAGGVRDVAPYLWAWGIGGVVGSVAVGPIVDRIGRVRGLMVVIIGGLALSQALLPLFAHMAAPLAVLPLVVWGMVGWATQVPQQQRLLELGGERRGGVAVAMNNSALYLGSAAGSALGGVAMSAGLTAGALPWAAAAVAALGLLLQVFGVRDRPAAATGTATAPHLGREAVAEERN
ncbi:MFS transporter [Spirillospora sp. NBC_01491]|uniref:MFS transporter n=1 Tax=Spirillospora sp. NBC_01491 TaxID=2976007 RepID=UPI002E2FC580|nr:MFS transporter [Spirillospora sp. NBC_01491]